MTETQSPNTTQRSLIFLKDYQPTDYAIPSVELVFQLDPEATIVQSKLTLERRKGAKSGTPLYLDGDALEFVSATLNGKPLPAKAYSVTPQQFILNKPPAKRFELEIATRLTPQTNTKLMGLYYRHSIYATQCEAEGFRRMTYFLDRPDVLSRYQVRLEADKQTAPQLLSNGNLIEQGELADGNRHYAIWEDPFFKPAYLFAVVAGDLACLEDNFMTCEGREVTLQIYAEHGQKDQCAYAMDALKRAMLWDETRYGRAYDLDRFMVVAIPDFNMGAMENKGLNIFNDKYVLADPQTATDQDYAGIETVIAHEYFHNWTGNRITCRDWFQLCLKEGLTVYRDQEFSADQRSRPVKRIADVRFLKAHQFPEDAGPLAHPVRPDRYEEIDNFYSATVYHKGAELVRMIAVFLGDAGFRKGMDLYFERHDGEATTVEAFLKAFEDATDYDLSGFFQWYCWAGTPKVTVEELFDDAATRRLIISQTHENPGTPALPIPLLYGYVDEDGQDVPVANADADNGLIVLNKMQATFVFQNVPESARLSIGRHFSAPVILQQNASPDDLMFLARHDTDPFNRWQALQTLAMNHLKSINNSILANQPPQPPRSLYTAINALLQEPTHDPDFIALCLQLPGPQSVAEALKTGMDPDAIVKAHIYAQAYLSLAHQDRLQEIYEQNCRPDDTDIQPEAAARRALKNACLDLLVATNQDRFAAIALQQADTAANMTDKMAALMSLCRHGRAERAEPLAAFYDTYQANGLVMNKWLQLQALTHSDDTLATVRALLHDPVFDLANPNRVQALIGGFASNFAQFNRLDGAGYRFVARQISALDTINPQVAARLLQVFRGWRMLEPGRQALAKSALDNICQADLSTNVADIIHRLLADASSL